MEDIILEAINLSYTYPDGTQALKNISMKIKRGQKIAVLGSNGAGKSTLFLNFNGVLRPQTGKIFFKGREVRYHRAGLTELRTGVGIVFQDPDTQLFSASVYQDVSFGALNLKLPPAIVNRRVDHALRGTDTYHLKDKPTHFLSYGEKKRVSIADVLVMEPEVIIFDEPTACLDCRNTLQIMTLFEELNKSGTTLIMATHDVDVTWAWADEVFILRDGIIEGAGSPERVFADEPLLRATGIETPIVLEMYARLRAVGFIEEPSRIPRTKQELFALIEKTPPLSFKIAAPAAP